MKFITFFEEKWTCSGICSSSMFYYTLPMSAGPPTETCLTYMKDEIQNNLTYMGMASLLCGIVMIVTWLCQYLLWKKYDD
jgi:small neutral amino acid transporter SnatA (MarC family)